jgi:hypothetical protein
VLDGDVVVAGDGAPRFPHGTRRVRGAAVRGLKDGAVASAEGVAAEILAAP